MNCPPEMAFVQNRIDRLNAEIAKGTDVYTPAELKVLNDKLNAAYEELNKTNSGY
jgi:phosphoenolpyruvate-protein kinase (PTS system EI component)